MIDPNPILNNIDPDLNFFDDIYLTLTTGEISPYFSVEEYNDKFKETVTCSTILNGNIQSFWSHYNQLLAFISSLIHPPEILVWTETWLRDSNTIIWGSLDGFTGFHTCRQVSRGGGVSIFVDGRHNACKIDDLCFIDETIEMCTARVSCYRMEFFLLRRL